jgi:phospholipid/cholesterol/gamma-HCH transport system substrate-binding protein
MISGTDTRFKNLEKKVGIFILLALIGVVGVVFFIVIENDLFTSTFDLRLTAPKGTGFSQGMPIKLSGFRIGRVKSITLNDSAAVDVLLQIDKKYKKWMRKDSVARLIKEGMIGDYIIEISSGTLPELIPENGLITLGKSKAFDEIADEIAEKVKPVLMDIRDIISYVNSEDGDVKKTLRNINAFTGKMEKSRQKVDTLLDTGTRTVDSTGKRFDILLTRVESRIDQTQPILAKADNSLQSVEKKLPQILEKVDLTLSHIESISKELKGTASETLPHVPRLINKSEGLIDQGEGLLEGMKSVWPLSSVMTPVDQKALIRRDSNE